MAKDPVIRPPKRSPTGAVLALFTLILQLAGCAGHVQPGEAMVATAHPLATQAALRALDQGGNAFDAAIAAASVLAVVEPYGAGLGGGGFWLLQKNNGDVTFIDAREKAPLSASHDMYLDANGHPKPSQPSRNGPSAAAIPGQPAAIAHINERYALRPLSANLADAILFARRGFRVEPVYQKMASMRLDALNSSPASTRIFLQNGEVPNSGYAIKQPELAETLFVLGRKGHDGFYSGDIAQKLLNDVTDAGGIWSAEDLKQYQIVERRPIEFDFQNYHIISAPLPSSGGITLQQMFGMLAYYQGPESVIAPTTSAFTRVHVLSEIMSLAYHDRNYWLGDSDFVTVPTADLVNNFYLRDQASQINAQEHRKASTATINDVDHHTTHVSVIDKNGNRVSATFSINLPFGSGFTSGATGVLLNNEMDDFAIAPGIPNAYGLVGSKANAIAPGKRPLSSMTPTLAESDDKVIIIRTPGGSRIISMVFLGLLDAFSGRSAEEVVSAPRFHHQSIPDQIQYEPDSLDSATMVELIKAGHTLQDVQRPYGNMQLIIWNKSDNRLDGASDPRGKGQTLHR